MTRKLLQAVLTERNPDGVGPATRRGERCNQHRLRPDLRQPPRRPSPAAAATRHLLSTQDPDGTIASVPDMLGTRPFLYDIPALGDHAALLALARLQSRLASVSVPAHLPTPQHR
ncbi:hypothetical protein ABZ705_20300 [Streptomyces sp. NPDC006984]|uniref:hypothetical protein n=1 Tax=Streptomyces sp. NPDC006984 TaxID=3155463 RepID=UPI0033DAEBC1